MEGIFLIYKNEATFITSMFVEGIFLWVKVKLLLLPVCFFGERNIFMCEHLCLFVEGIFLCVNVKLLLLPVCLFVKRIFLCVNVKILLLPVCLFVEGIF